MKKQSYSLEQLRQCHEFQLHLIGKIIHEHNLILKVHRDFVSPSTKLTQDYPEVVVSNNINEYRHQQINNVEHYIRHHTSFIPQEGRKCPVWDIETKPGEFFAHLYRATPESQRFFFLKTMGYCFSKEEVVAAIQQHLTPEDFWVYLTNLKPFDFAKKSPPLQSDFLVLAKHIQQYQIDNPAKVEAYASFLQYYKPIVKRSNYIYSVVGYIAQNIDSQHFKLFEAILGQPVEAAKPSAIPSILQPSAQAQCLVVKQEELFTSISLGKISQTKDYNSYLQQLCSCLNGSEVASRLGLEHVSFVPFSGAGRDARIYLSSTPQGFEQDMQDIFFRLIKQCAPYYNSQTEIGVEKIIASMEYIRLDNKLEQLPQSTPSRKRKI